MSRVSVQKCRGSEECWEKRISVEVLRGYLVAKMTPKTRDLCTAGCSHLDPGLSTGYRQRPISKTERGFIKQRDKWLNPN